MYISPPFTDPIHEERTHYSYIKNCHEPKLLSHQLQWWHSKFTTDKHTSAENQKGCLMMLYVEKQKGANAIDYAQRASTLLVLNRTALNNINALLAFRMSSTPLSSKTSKTYMKK